MKKLKLATIITIISISLMGCSNSEILNNKTVTIDEAKEIALKHVGLSSDQVSFKRVELDFDNEIQTYEVEFYYNNREYSYEIDASTGDVLSYEQD